MHRASITFIITIMAKWVVIKIVNGLPEAHIIKGLLESNDIPVRLEYEAIGQIYGLTVDGLGQVKILIPEEFYDEAKSLLED